MSSIQESVNLAIALLQKVASTLQAIPVDDGGGEDPGGTIDPTGGDTFPLGHYFDSHYFDPRYFNRHYFG